MITWSGAQLCASLTWDRDVLTDEVHALRWLIAHTGLAIGGAGAADRFNLDAERPRCRRCLPVGLLRRARR